MIAGEGVKEVEMQGIIQMTEGMTVIRLIVETFLETVIHTPDKPNLIETCMDIQVVGWIIEDLEEDMKTLNIDKDPPLHSAKVQGLEEVSLVPMLSIKP